MNNNPFFSIVVPVYKTEKYLPQCLDSIINQSFADFEIVAVDDGSPDNCAKILETYSEKDNRIKVVTKPNGGLVSARKAGFLKCTGNYVLNVDSDDYIADGLLEKLYDIIQKHNPDIISFDYIYFDNVQSKNVRCQYKYGLYDGDALCEISDNIIYDKNLPSLNMSGMPYGVALKAIRREKLAAPQLSVPDSVTIGEDLAVTSKILSECNSLYISDFLGYYYRRNEKSMVHTFNPSTFHNIEILCDYLESNLDDKYKNNINVYALCSFQMYLIAASHAISDIGAYKKCIKENLSEKMSARINNAKISKPTLKDRVYLILVRLKMWNILYRLYNR